MWNDVKALNHLTRAMLGGLVLAVMFALYHWIAAHAMFDLVSVQIKPAHSMPLRYIDVATVRSTALPKIRGNYFSADLNTARAAFESVPWVQHASVRREWPNQLIVLVDEYQVLGTWGGEEGRLISVDGVLFTANLAEAEAEGVLPELDGPDQSAREVALRLADLREWLKPVGLAPHSLKLSQRYAWSAKLDNGIVLNLGRVTDRAAMQARVTRFVTVYPQLAAAWPGTIESVDMRYPNGLALKRRSPASSTKASASAA